MHSDSSETERAIWGAVEQLARQAARRAGQLLRERLDQERQIHRKTSSNDLVTEMDRAAEAMLVGEVREHFPDHGLRCEEGSQAMVQGPVEYLWHIDPIDGTNNYVHHFPWFAVSIGVQQFAQPTRAEEFRTAPSRLVVGVIYHVMPDEMYSAVLGQGARLNDLPLRVSQAETLQDSLLATGFPYWISRQQEPVLSNLARFLPLAHGIRRAGAASLDLAMVAAGRYDGYWEQSLQSWDVAAGILLVREAGGRVSDYDGHQGAIHDDHLIASNGRIHEAMVDLLRGRYQVPALTPG